MAVFRTQQTIGVRRIQAIVRKGGYSLSKVFWRTGQAQDWARRVEDAIASATPSKPFDRSAWIREVSQTPVINDAVPHAGWTLDRALKHYGQKVSVKKKGAVQEQAKIVILRREAWAVKRLDGLTHADVQGYADSLVAAGLSGSTVRLRIMVLRALYRDAVKLWKLAVVSPCDGVALPAPAAHRTRRLQDGHEDGQGEEERLRAVLAGKPAGGTMLDLMDLAIDTGMRQSELLGITAGQCRKVEGVETIEQPDSKNGDPRHVTLSTRAAAIIRRRAKGKSPDELLFPWKPADLRQRWNVARKEAGVLDFRWHDLRHEGLSRMAAKGMHIGMLSAQSGHRTVAVLKRYLNAKPQEVKKLLG